MAHQSPLIATDVEAYLAEHEHKDLLRVLTCGSVDDGKSTLIGRLLHDTNLIYEDQLAALTADSVTSGTTGDRPDLALLMDGLKAEREQGITIDVAYRYFSTSRRTFVLADAPGHEQYTRNMVTGASTCQLAVILVDASRGVLDQTRRHSTIASLLGIRHVVVAVNKMDLVDYSRERFEQIRDEYLRFAEDLEIGEPYLLPISALEGDNIVTSSAVMDWFDGPPLLTHLETVDAGVDASATGLRFPVQLVRRPDRRFRGFAGTVASGTVAVGDRVVALPSGVATTVARIVTADGDLHAAHAGEAVTLTLDDEVDVSRGDLLVAADDRPHRAHDLDAVVVWMSSQPAEPGRQLLLQSVNGLSNASLRTIRHRVDVTTLAPVPAASLSLNDIARCTITAERELLFDAYRDNPVTGSFILVDRLTNVTVGAGMVVGPASRWDEEPSGAMQHHPSEVTADERRARLGQRPATILLTGMTGAGKSTLALALERRLFDLGRTLLRLDGEELRLGLSRDLGFSLEERSESLRRAAEIARLANQQGLIVVVAVQAPQGEVRERIRELVGTDRFVEVHLDAADEVRRARDPNGLYRAADRGELADIPGVTVTYEVPVNADLRLDTGAATVAACVDAIVALLGERGVLGDG